jgi:hypothetical protein
MAAAEFFKILELFGPKSKNLHDKQTGNIAPERQPEH